MHEMSRSEHLQWCKKRALEYVDNDDIPQAVASMASDLSKHEETRGHAAIGLMMQMLMTGLLDSPFKAREFIEGFN